MCGEKRRNDRMENYHQQPGQLVQSLMQSIDKENRRTGGLTIEPIRSIVQSSSSSLFRLCSVLRFGRWDREYQIGGNQQRILAFSLLNEKNNPPGLILLPWRSILQRRLARHSNCRNAKRAGNQNNNKKIPARGEQNSLPSHAQSVGIQWIWLS